MICTSKSVQLLGFTSFCGRFLLTTFFFSLIQQRGILNKNLSTDFCRKSGFPKFYKREETAFAVSLNYFSAL